MRKVIRIVPMTMMLLMASCVFVQAQSISKLGGDQWGAWDPATLDAQESFAIAKCSASGELTVKVFLSEAHPFAGPSGQLGTLKAYLMVDGSGFLVGETVFALDSFGNGSVTINGGSLAPGPHYIWLQIANVDGQMNYDLPHTANWPSSPTTWTIYCR